MSSHRPPSTIQTLPDNDFVEIFSLCRMGEVVYGVQEPSPMEMAETGPCLPNMETHHVCVFTPSPSGTSLHHGTPVKKILGYFPAFPIVVSYRCTSQGVDRDHLFAALEHRDRVGVVELKVPYQQLFEDLLAVMQEPFPVLTHLLLEPGTYMIIPVFPDTFLGGFAPRLQTIYMSRIPFPAAPTLLSSARDLVDVVLRNIPPAGYIPPEAMVASLAALPRLESFTFQFDFEMSYPVRMRLLPITRKVLPALTVFHFKGLFEYFEDLVAQIDAPQLDALRIEYQEQEVTDFQIPQLCKFFDRSEKFKLFRFKHADLFVEPGTIVIDFLHDQLSFTLSVQEEAIGQVVNQISAMLSDVTRLVIGSNYGELDDDIRWLELFHPFTSVETLSVDEELSSHIALVLNNITGERAAEVLPALELLRLVNEPVTSVKEFVAARQNMDHAVTVIDEEEFDDRLNVLDIVSE
ncbi:hypothetical protein EDB89DRAFT_1326499 [Lactarius sanguifluus]|nr:hypothetical protein EDB89DRAFT_1326499 [Lactarius sanguifluus]